MKKLSKEILEIINSFAWFFMDAFWMLGELNFAYLCIVPTVLSGIWLVFKEDNKAGGLVAASAMMWAIMNSVWLVGEENDITHYLILCKICFAIGIGTLIAGLMLSQDISKTLSVFRRFKLRNKIK